MSQKTRGLIHLVYGIALGCLILAVGVCFALSCISIYQSGDPPFTAERIAAHYARFAPLVYVTLGGILVGILLAWLLPRRDLMVGGPDDDPPDVIVERYRRGLYRPVKDPAAILKRLLSRVDEEALSPACRAALAKERRLRRTVTVCAAILMSASLLPALVWCVDASHFSIENLQNDVVAAASFILPCGVVSLAIGVAATYLNSASVLRETAAVKTAMAEAKGKLPRPQGVEEKRPFTQSPRFLWILRGSILAVGILFILLGIRNGGMADVLGKAIRICTECIGLG